MFLRGQCIIPNLNEIFRTSVWNIALIFCVVKGSSSSSNSRLFYKVLITRPLFVFTIFSNMIVQKKNFWLQTRIDRVEGENADHQTSVPPKTLKLLK